MLGCTSSDQTELAGAFQVSGAVIIIGDVTIDGSLTAYGDGSDNQLVVVGNVTVGALAAEADILISGRLTAELLIRTDDHYSLAVGCDHRIGALLGEWGSAALRIGQLDELLVAAVAAAREPSVAFGLERVAGRPLWQWCAPTGDLVTQIVEFARRTRIEPAAVMCLIDMACGDFHVTPSELSVGLDHALERDLFRDPDEVRFVHAMAEVLARADR